ncbi:MAG TPA: hypothetical protein VGO93_25340 [Candidatus Xenobia bacterium]|jgi:hypothetical protein
MTEEELQRLQLRTEETNRMLAEMRRYEADLPAIRAQKSAASDRQTDEQFRLMYLKHARARIEWRARHEMRLLERDSYYRARPWEALQSASETRLRKASAESGDPFNIPRSGFSLPD